jgi:hypothetical protein
VSTEGQVDRQMARGILAYFGINWIGLICSLLQTGYVAPKTDAYISMG